MTEQTIKNKIQAKGRIHVCGVTCHQGDANCNGYCIDAKVPHAKLIEASPDESAIEAEIVAKGKTAPCVTPADIEEAIVDEVYFTAKDGVIGIRWEAQSNPENVTAANIDSPLWLLTFCVLVLKNGFTVTGESACASSENFDAAKGRKWARENAINKVWPLMGYALKEKLAAHAALNDHIKAPEHTLMRKAEADIDMLRSALAGLIGVDTEDELRQMETTMRLFPAPEADKAVSINAIHALLQTLPPTDFVGKPL